jgi:hypothetical protein
MATTNDQVLSSLLAEIQALRKDVADLKGTQASSKPARKTSTSKTSDPDAPRKPRAPTSWDTFRAKVQAALKEGGLTANAMSYASYLKTTYEDAYTWDNEAIISTFAEYTPPPPKPRKPKDEAEAEAATESKPKPKRTLTPEHLAKMQAGRKAAAEARKATEAASKAAESHSEPEASPKPPPKPAATTKLTPLPFRGKRLAWDPATNHTWLRGPDADDGSLTRGAWFGILSADKKSVDTSIPDPSA